MPRSPKGYVLPLLQELALFTLTPLQQRWFTSTTFILSSTSLILRLPIKHFHLDSTDSTAVSKLNCLKGQSLPNFFLKAPQSHLTISISSIFILRSLLSPPFIWFQTSLFSVSVTSTRKWWFWASLCFDYKRSHTFVLHIFSFFLTLSKYSKIWILRSYHGLSLL